MCAFVFFPSLINSLHSRRGWDEQSQSAPHPHDSRRQDLLDFGFPDAHARLEIYTSSHT